MPPKNNPFRALPKRVFVTGGAGFIGSHVVKRLVEEGCEVTCLILPNDPAPALRGIPHHRLDGDLSSTQLLEEGMAGCELVIHLAAIYAIWLPNVETMYQVNVEGTRNVMRSARRTGVKRVVHTSSIAAVGVKQGQSTSDESTPYSDWDNPDPYVLSKYISELEALAANGNGLEVVAVNPAFPFGENDLAPTPTGRLIINQMTGKLPFVVAGGFNAVFVADVAEGHLLAAIRGTPGERYLLSGHNITYDEFGIHLARIMGTRPPVLTMPTQAAKLWGWASEKLADHITHRPPLTTYRSVTYAVGRHLYFSCEKAQRELGYAPSPLDETLRTAVTWFEPRLKSFESS